MDIEAFLQPVNNEVAGISDQLPKNSLRFSADVYLEEGKFPDASSCQIALIGVPEERGTDGNTGCADAPDFIRHHLYRLACGNYLPKISDLGNVRRGNELKDTYAAVSIVCSELITRGIVPIILGGSQDITYAQYLAYKELNRTINMIAVDELFDLGHPGEKHFNAHNYLGKIILHQPNFLFNFSNIGYQTHFVGQESVQLMEKLYFDAYRLGQVRNNMEEIEPVIRSADLLSFDISAIRSSDAPGNLNASPNGFFGEEACQIVRYAGMSEKISSVGFYETNPKADVKNQTSFLVAQMIWYFIDGFYNRKNEDPLSGKMSFKKYRVAIKGNVPEIVFYKSKMSERWWMEVPYPDSKDESKPPHIIPCSYVDYESACQEEIPERWWLAFQKMLN